MIISINWLKKFISVNLPVDQLIELIGRRLVEVEEVVDLREKYKNVIIAEVEQCQKIASSDHLSHVLLNDNGVVDGVERDAKGFVSVVCGAPNIASGQLIAWLPPDSIVPESYSKTNPHKLSVKKIQNFTSNGMVASARELDLYDDHEGILVIDKPAHPGSNFAEVYNLNDYLIDIENKSLTRRPDAFGVIGFAREVSAIQGNIFKSPDWFRNLKPDWQDVLDPVQLSATIKDPELCARYQIVVLEIPGQVELSIEMKSLLARVGVRPVSPIVDITNYLMLLSGQPLHAFDYDKVLKISPTGDLSVRSGKTGETITLLDGKVVELTEEDIVIAAGDTPLMLGGVMGGKSTAIDKNTKRIALEAATFNLYNIRSTQMRHSVTSEAATRFTKGQPAEITAPTLEEAINLFGSQLKSKPVSNVLDVYPHARDVVDLIVTVKRVNDVLGSKFNTDDILKTLKNAEFGVELVSGSSLRVIAPYWRTDIELPEDIIEEIGRINGFDKIALKLPGRDFTAVMLEGLDTLKSRIRGYLVEAGANEVLTYSFIHGDILMASSQDVTESYRLVNSISPDLQYYRQSLTPSLLELVHSNIKANYNNFGLFELNKVHSKSFGVDKDKIPNEKNSLAFVFAKSKRQTGAAYYQVKSILDFLAYRLNVNIDYQPLVSYDEQASAFSTFEPKRSAVVRDRSSGLEIGVVGEYNGKANKYFKLPECSAGFELNVDALLTIVRNSANKYSRLSRFPSIARDISVQVSSNIKYYEIFELIDQSLSNDDVRVEIEPLSIYQADDKDKKTFTYRLKFTPNKFTMTNDQANLLISKIQVLLKDGFGAEII